MNTEFTTQVNNLRRFSAQDLEGCLITATPKNLSDTKSNFRYSVINSSLSGDLLTDKLIDLLSGAITDYCMPRARLSSAMNSRNALEVSELIEEARSLFVDSNKSGEAGELLLYLLTESLVEAPQIISKMDLKTSTDMHFHGADGVHIKAIPEGLALYWGEAKIHSNRTAAVRECLKSIEPFLKVVKNGNPIRDFGLLRNHLDAEEKELRDKLVNFFIKSKPEWNRLSIRATCLIGFNHKDYPKHMDLSSVEADTKLMQEVESWCSNLEENIDIHKVGDFIIEFFLIPFKDIEEFRKSFNAKVKGKP